MGKKILFPILAFPHGSYEVNKTLYVEGIGEELAQTLVKMLNDCKNKS